MEIRVLQYFLAVAREGSIIGAAAALNMTQPPLSRQLKDLEEEVGVRLFHRGSKRITLTDEGMLLRKRAEEIVELMEIAKAEISPTEQSVSGEINIGCAESEGMRFLAKIVKKVQEQYPHIRFNYYSGNAQDVMERLDRGLFDFGVFAGAVDMGKYEFTALPRSDTWGVMMRSDSPLAAKKSIKPSDLLGLPIINSNQTVVSNIIAGWMGGDFDKLNIVATYNLPMNAFLLAEEGVGYVLTFDKLIKTTDDDRLVFRPLEPRLEAILSFAWKKYSVHTKATEKFLAVLKQQLADGPT